MQEMNDTIIGLFIDKLLDEPLASCLHILIDWNILSDKFEETFQVVDLRIIGDILLFENFLFIVELPWAVGKDINNKLVDPYSFRIFFFHEMFFGFFFFLITN